MKAKFIFSASKLPTANDLGDGFMRRIKRHWCGSYLNAVLNYNRIIDIDKIDKCVLDPKTETLRKLLRDMKTGKIIF